MPPLESDIDDLYKGSLDDFVAGRTKLAKSLTGADAKRVKALGKPTIVPWAVNQVYWHARPAYDRLVKAGAALRSAQVAALAGRSADVRAATESHRKAVTEAVAEASRLAARAGAHPGLDTLARTFEAVSLASDTPDPPGRLVKILAPQGFEALAGVAIKPVAHAQPKPAIAAVVRAPDESVVPPRIAEDTRKREREQAAAERHRRAAIQRAETVLRRAEAAESRTRRAWERAQEERQKAAAALAGLRTK